jgi:hypothetical protein
MFTLEYVNRVYAEGFLRGLAKAFPEEEYLTDYVNELLDPSMDDDILCENIHRTMTYILSFCMGLTLQRDLSLDAALFDMKKAQASTDTHFGRTFKKLLTRLERGDGVKVIKELLEAMPAPEETDETEPAEGVYKIIENETTSSLEKLNVYKENGIPEDALKYALEYAEDVIYTAKLKNQETQLGNKIIITQLFASMDSGKGIPDKVKRYICMIMTQKSVCAFDVKKIGTGANCRLYKALMPGENSFIAVYNDLPPKCIYALNEFWLGIMEYKDMLQNLHIFDKRCVKWLDNPGRKPVRTQALVKKLMPDEEAFYEYCLSTHDYMGKADEKWNDFAYKLGRKMRNTNE